MRAKADLNRAWAQRLPFIVRGRTNMSIALYRYRVFWNGRQGALRSGGRTRQLDHTPALPGSETLEIEEIDYAPEVQVAQLRESGADWREMSPSEVAGAETLLAMLASAEPMQLAAAA
jgi:hypothetical protein